MMRALWVSVVGLLLCAPAASAQIPAGVYVRFSGTGITATPGEPGGAFSMQLATDLQKTETHAMSIMPDYCGFPGASHGAIRPGATGGWTADITPLRVEGETVTFRLKWTRYVAAGAPGRVGGDLEVTLGPGDSMPIDILPTPRNPATCPPGRGNVAILLSVSIDRQPDDDREHRLMATDLWLIEKMPDGSERTQPLSVRNLPSRSTPFFFDSVTDGGAVLDFYGDLVASPGVNGATIELTTRSRLIQSGQVNVTLRQGQVNGNTLFVSRQVKTDLTLQNGAVASVELPRLSENDGGAFASHTFSIRVRTRQVR
jgi:hypothetical protein